MTDRHAGYTVTLREDVREDDSEAIMNALRMVKGVMDVRPIASDSSVMVAHVRLSTKLRNALYEAIDKALESNNTYL